MNMYTLAADLPPIITPESGLVIWTTIVFLLVLVILRRFAWKPILTTVNDRVKTIESSLKEAEKAREEMANMTAENEKILIEAKEERARILKDAKEAGEKIRIDLQEKAAEEYAKKVADAAREIDNKKMAAIIEVKNKAGQMAVQIAEEIMRKQLKDKDAQEKYVTELVDDYKI